MNKINLEVHEILHLVHQLQLRISNLIIAMDNENQQQPIDMSKSALINALWEQNADRPKEEIIIEVNKHFGIDAPHIKGFPFTKEELTGNMPDFINYGCKYGDERIDAKESARDYQEIDVSTDYKHWEELYYQSIETNAELRKELERTQLRIHEFLHAASLFDQ